MSGSALHTILGANGLVGRALSAELRTLGVSVRQVSRTPAREHREDDIVTADVLDAAATSSAVQGSAVVYLLAGLPYDAAVWERDWPRVLEHTIHACAQHDAKLVFLDNVYAYGRSTGVMTEDTPIRPSSRKGEVRARLHAALTQAMQQGRVRSMIVRSADFYSADAGGTRTSMLNSAVFERLAQGKAAQWLGRTDMVHAFTYVPDLARSLAFLASRDDAYGQVWHALTSHEERTGAELVRMAAERAGRPPRVQAAGRTLLRMLSWFQPAMREHLEMLYQFEEPYRFSSEKLERYSGLTPTTFADGFDQAMARIGRG